ncbi:MAG: hypothetical protein R6V26_09970 [Roseovarius sp.]
MERKSTAVASIAERGAEQDAEGKPAVPAQRAPIGLVGQDAIRQTAVSSQTEDMAQP